ncbi:MAG: FmdB family transcriptional regulator [Planctomycetota bacterium]|nr:MAG: FmdB family transcriptional regulator [Planctomycetota bacterium]
MPTYDYACTECDHRFEHFQSMTSDPLSECPECKGKLRRLIGKGGGLIFKGSGFYETDYKRKGSSPASESKSSKETSTASGSKTASGTGDASSGS